MKFLLGLSIFIILLFMGIFYYHSCKKTADEFVHKYIEEKNEMKKIVIVTSRPEPDYGLLASLNTLFPDCEIHVVFKKSETVVQYPASYSSNQLMAHTGDIVHLTKI